MKRAQFRLWLPIATRSPARELTQRWETVLENKHGSRRFTRLRRFVALGGAVRQVDSLSEFGALSGQNAICAWAAGAGQSAHIWAVDGAVGVLGTALSGRDRLAVSGRPEAVATLVDRAFAEHHHAVRVLGDADLIAALGEVRPDLVVSETFGWMQVDVSALCRPVLSRPASAQWLPLQADPEIADLLTAHFPASYATPGVPGVRRWAGIRGTDDRLVAVAAEAWTAPGLGFMAGVATAASARGHGYARAVCHTVLARLCAEHGRAALIVDEWNATAVRLYLDLGMTWRSVRSARHHTVRRGQTTAR